MSSRSLRSPSSALALLLTVLPSWGLAACGGSTGAPTTGAWEEVAATGSTGTAAAADALPYLEALPPLIDRELLLGDASISASQISPDGRFLSFVRPYQGVRNLWVKGIDEPFDAARPMTADERPVRGYFWSQDSRSLLYVQDKGGDEDFHIYRLDPRGEAEGATGVPAAEDLTPLAGVRALIYAVPKATPDRILVGLNDRDPALHDVYRLDLGSGERTLVAVNEGNVAGWLADLDGNLRLAVRLDDEGGTQILRVEDGEVGELVYGCSWEEHCDPERFAADGRQVWMRSNAGDRDLVGLARLDVETGDVEFVEADPEGEVDLAEVLFSEVSEEPLATVYAGDRVRYQAHDDRFARWLEFLRAELPDGDLAFESLTRDDRYLKVVLSSDVEPGSVYLLDTEELVLTHLYDTRPELAEVTLAPMRPLRYAARDGREIPAYLTVPPGVEERALALVVMPHGGPWARDYWGFDAFAQLLANRGYAVLQPNFRGSEGFGKDFLNAGNGEWGTGAMQHDITDGVRHLVEEGIADPARVCIYGGSYGGYATLAGLAFTPELYACGISFVGPSNIVTLINSVPAYWGPIRKIFDRRIGDLNDPGDRARMEEQSPLNSADAIRAPLLVVQGANDPRVKQAESDQIVATLVDLGRDVEYLVAPDEGHGFAGLENRMAFVVASERFFARHLGGRVQEEVPEEISARLAAITVDPATVEMPRAADGLDAVRTAPLPEVDAVRVALGTASYVSTMEMHGEEMTQGVERTVEWFEEPEGTPARLRIVDEADGEHAGYDTVELDATSLRPLSRNAQQGPLGLEVEYGEEEVRGSLKAGGREMPFTLALEAPVFGDAAAFDSVIAALPLAEGYRTTLRTVEIGAQQRVRIWEVEVEGEELVDVQAGAFEAWRVAVRALDGEGWNRVVWLGLEEPRRVLRAESELPAEVGGGSVTTELIAVSD